ncbi:MAG: beta-galactosidase [Fimbriimonas sp.]|nr:beta-galactosidase [Fimbriimonas sp.]
MKPKFILMAVSIALVCLAAAKPPVSFTDPSRVRYDGQCFTINGRDTFIYSGAFHYFRCPRELWADRFRKIKDAGFNTVESYIPWNEHEKGLPGGLNDLSKADLRECQEWLKMAIDDFGLNVIVRPGPYICSEWDSGGYPQWLMKFRPKNAEGAAWLRTDDPTYLDWCRHWYREVCPAIAPFQITHRPIGKPGIILFQIENEYDYAGGADSVHIGQLKALADEAHKSGIDVPLVTCWTHQVRGSTDSVLSQVFDCCNFYPRWDVEGTRGSLDYLRSKQPGAPLMVMELQGGWFSENGGLLAEDQPGITAPQINNLTLYCIQNGLAALNYYMLFGGTNFGDRTPPNITTSYDYFAPIREDGALGEKYRAVAGIGEFLKEHGAELVRSKLLPDEAKQPDPQVGLAVREDAKGNRFVFVRNRSHETAKSGEATISGMSFHYDLEPFGSKVLFVPAGTDDANKGAWYPRPVPALPVPPTANTVRVTTAQRRYEDGGDRWSPAKIGMPFSDQGVYDARYTVFSATFDSPDANHATLWMKTFDHQDAVVRVNGRLIPAGGTRLGAQLFTVLGLRPSGNQIQVLLENSGFVNGGPMDAPRGIEDVRLVTKPVPAKLIPTWWIKKVDSRDAPAEVADTYLGSGFHAVTIGPDGAPELAGSGATAVYRTSVSISKAEIDAGQTVLEFGCIDDDGWIYVNGRKVGEHHRWDVPAVIDIKPFVRTGDNTIAVVVRNREGAGGLTKPVTLLANPESSVKLAWQWTPQLQGVHDQWFWRTETGDDWETIWIDGNMEIPRKVTRETAPTDGTKSGHLMAWYKMNFSLPAKRADEATRRLLISTVGNGFIYLNGHLLGRIWQQGPQREYYLPENWLNWDDRPNDLTVCLRPVKGVEALQAVEVAAYPDRRNQ